MRSNQGIKEDAQEKQTGPKVLFGKLERKHRQHAEICKRGGERREEKEEKKKKKKKEKKKKKKKKKKEVYPAMNSSSRDTPRGGRKREKEKEKERKRKRERERERRSQLCTLHPGTRREGGRGCSQGA